MLTAGEMAPRVENESKDRTPESHISRKLSIPKTPTGVSFVKDSKVFNSAKTMDIRDFKCFTCHKKGNFPNKCSDATGKDGKDFFRSYS